MERTGLKDWNVLSSPTLKVILSHISHRITKSIMMGEAKRESWIKKIKKLDFTPILLGLGGLTTIHLSL